MQGSQPSTASPFKQDVFVYSASPGSESPSMGAAATPVIMSRSPTGGCPPGGAAPESQQLPGRDSGSGRGAPWGHAQGMAVALVLCFHREFASLLSQRWLLRWLCLLHSLLTDICSSLGNSLSPRNEP